MNNEDTFSLWLFVIVAVMGGLVGVLIGQERMERYYQAEAIQHGCAQYNQTTGEWGWR